MDFQEQDDGVAASLHGNARRQYGLRRMMQAPDDVRSKALLDCGLRQIAHAPDDASFRTAEDSA